jgi:acyl transferase domain-containing protein/NADPH:quinone reductase-like Zn-dependent oxidoreductase
MNPFLKRISGMSTERLALLAAGLQSKVERLEAAQREPIAVVGLACRFPGGANTPERFWENLIGGRCSVSRIPKERWDVDAIFDADPAARGKMYAPDAATLEGVDQFDAAFFGISPREAAAMDPQQRLVLEVAWEAFERAGLSAAELRNTRTGVFIGMMNTDWMILQTANGELRDIDAYTATGLEASFPAGRLSYVFGLQGPSVAVATACSSSLTGIHLACQSLRTGESELAIAGGVNLILSPSPQVSLCRIGSLAPDGLCKTFDDAANGYVRGEGCGLVVLRRLSDALAHGDQILAVIRGSAVNSDGASGGLTVPSGPAQQAVVRRALANAGVDPATVGYVEAHGTGTPLGDPIEIHALGAVLGEGRDPANPVLVGSVKTNLGHLEAAAGIAGFMKAVLAVQHGEIPPHLHLKNPNPLIDWDRAPVRVASERTSWQNDGPRIAGVSSFGLSGINAHVVIEQAPIPPAPERAPAPAGPFVLPLSAKTRPALAAIAERYAAHLEGSGDPSLVDVCFTAAAGRSHFSHRAVVVGSSRDEIVGALRAFASGVESPAVAYGRVEKSSAPKVAFLFPGQGPQHVGMGLGLYESEPVFRAALDKCDELLRDRLPIPLLEVLYPASGASPIDETNYTQPALFAVQYALAELWKSWGVEPTALLGHSAGEYVAATVAGVCTLEDGLKLIAERGRLMHALPPRGLMAAVFADERRVRAVIAARSNDVSIAALNNAGEVVISGLRDAVEEVARTLEAEGVDVRRLTISVASHSPLIEPVLDEFARIGDTIAYGPPHIDIVSNLTGTFAGPEDFQSGSYWRRQIRNPVRFSDGVRALRDRGVEVFVEIGPKATLVGMAQRCIEAPDASWLTSLQPNQPARSHILRTLGALYVRGVPIDWRGVLSSLGPAKRVVLPTYPFERERHWAAPAPRSAAISSRVGRTSRHPLLGARISSPLPSIQFERIVSGDDPGYLAEHRVYGAAVFPGAGYLELAQAAAIEAYGAGDYAIEEVSIQAAMVLPEGVSRRVQVVLDGEPGEPARFRISSAADGDEAWSLHAEGSIRRAEPFDARRSDLEAWKQRCAEPADVDAFYVRVREAGIDYGPRFRTIRNLWAGKDEWLVELEGHETLAPGVGRYQAHPALLDGCFQVIGAVTTHDRDVFLPFAVESLRILAPLGTRVFGHAVLRPQSETDRETLTFDMQLVDEHGVVSCEVEGMCAKRGSRDAVLRGASRPWSSYHVAWEPCPVPELDDQPLGPVVILADSQGTGAALRARLAERGADVVLVQRGTEYQRVSAGAYRIDPSNAGDYARLLEAIAPSDARRATLVYMWSLDVRPPELLAVGDVAESTELACRDALFLTQACSTREEGVPPRIVFVTRGAQSVRGVEPTNPFHAPLWGMARALVQENPSLSTTLVDLDWSTETSEAEELVREVVSAGPVESQIAIRSGRRYAPRLRGPSESQGLPSSPLPNEPYAIEIGEYGRFASLTFTPLKRQPPPPGRYEVEVKATAVNLDDVLKVMGVVGDPSDTSELGYECSGIVSAIGEGVTGVKLGERVVAHTPRAYGTYAFCHGDIAGRIPPAMTYEEAATIPVAFLTALDALRNHAALRAGERALIHVTPGGTGVAAAQLGRMGADVLVVANRGSWPYLRSLGVERIVAPTAQFDEEIRRLTGGAGVHVVVNSRTGQFIEKSFALLEPGGRFVELGSRDIWTADDAARARPDVVYTVSSLYKLVQSDPKQVGAMLTEVMGLFGAGELQPLPGWVFPLADAPAAFEAASRGKQLGKVIASHATIAGARVRADATYLVTGGLGGLGLLTARRLIESGARHLVLVGRSAPSPSAEASLAELRSSGANVRVERLDVSDFETVQALIDDIDLRMPPLRGVVHAAGTLADGVLQGIPWDRFRSVLAPKVMGAWNLHLATRRLPLDFFVLFSSIASIFAAPGQGNYAAANAFLDALAYHRRSLGLAGMSIDWGPWAGVGLAAHLGGEDDRKLNARAMTDIEPGPGMEIFESLLQSAETHVTVLGVDWGKWLALYPQTARLPFFSELVAPSTGEAGAPTRRLRKEELVAASPSERRTLMVTYLADLVARGLGMPASALDGTRRLADYGFDSLMSVELKNRTQADLAVTLPMVKFVEGPSVEELATLFLERLGLAEQAVDAGAVVAIAPPAEDLVSVAASVPPRTPSVAFEEGAL